MVIVLDRVPLRWVIRASVRSCGSAPMNAVASASISCCSITCSAWRITSVESEALSASSTSSKADWDRAIVWFSFESSLAGSYEASHGGSSTFRNQAGSYTTDGDVT